MAGGWAHGLWCSTAYMSSHYYLVPYNDVPLFDRPVIWSSRYFDVPYMSSCYYVVPFHVVPLFDRPIDLSCYLPILSFISPTSSHYYVVVPSFVPLLFWRPIDVLLEMKGCKTFTGIKISFWTGQCVYQYSSSCGFTYLTSSMRFCPDNQHIFWFRAGCIENTLTLLTRQSMSHHQTSLSHVLFMVQPIKYLIYLWGQVSDDLCRGY